jgi:hypothetical protein
MISSRYEKAETYYRRMVEGHVYIRETIEAFLETLGARIERAGTAPHVVELGSHAGFISERIMKRWPRVRLSVVEDNASFVELSQQRLAGHAVAFHQSLATLTAAPDIVVSLARHHHLPHGYLADVYRAMRTESVYVLGDELCPEYCDGEHRARIERAEVLEVRGGYVFTSAAEAAAFASSGAVPAAVLDLERRRQRSLWRWYRFVVDEAVEHGFFEVAVAELKSTHDDLITGSQAEHKFSPSIVEREFALAGFRRLSKQLIGPPDQLEHQSMFVYEYERV